MVTIKIKTYQKDHLYLLLLTGVFLNVMLGLIPFDEYGKAVIENVNTFVFLVYGFIYVSYLEDRFFYEKLSRKIKTQSLPLFVRDCDNGYLEIFGGEKSFIDLSK